MRLYAIPGNVGLSFSSTAFVSTMLTWQSWLTIKKVIFILSIITWHSCYRLEMSNASVTESLWNSHMVIWQWKQVSVSYMFLYWWFIVLYIVPLLFLCLFHGPPAAFTHFSSVPPAKEPPGPIFFQRKVCNIPSLTFKF